MRAALTLLVCVSLAGCSGSGGPTLAELFDTSAAAEGTGIQGVGLVRAVVILARHEAAPRQRQIAEQNAVRAVAAIERQIAQETAARPTPRATGKKPAKVAKPRTMPARIAVRTVKDDRTSPKAEAAVMLYDTRARRIVGNEVYDIEQEPQPGETVRFDTQTVRYVGASAF